MPGACKVALSKGFYCAQGAVGAQPRLIFSDIFLPLIPDVLSNHFFFQANRCRKVSPGPKVHAVKIAQLPLEMPGYCYRTLPFRVATIADTEYFGGILMPMWT